MDKIVFMNKIIHTNAIDYNYYEESWQHIWNYIMNENDHIL